MNLFPPAPEYPIRAVSNIRVNMITDVKIRDFKYSMFTVLRSGSKRGGFLVPSVKLQSYDFSEIRLRYCNFKYPLHRLQLSKICKEKSCGLKLH
jgi:hypothetical protein